MHRLRGGFAAAEADYRRASQLGYEPQPGLALLRLAQGSTAAAIAAIRRVVSATTDPLHRARLLSAHVEIALAVAETEEAEHACRELEATATFIGQDVAEAIAAQARGATLLARGDAAAAPIALHRAFEVWQAIAAPYEAARVRVLIGLACAALGDGDGAELELAAARAVFEALGAAPDLARVDAIAAGRRRGSLHGLTPREVHVLRLVSSGRTNRVIADELCLSERTIERHLSNILTKLDLPTRTAATSWAYEHDLI
jgi:DNA-binding NarL/FixJ family response regulator